jgi:hypothetical protein
MHFKNYQWMMKQQYRIQSPKARAIKRMVYANEHNEAIWWNIANNPNINTHGQGELKYSS